MTRHVVFGAGLIGGYITGVLLSQKRNVGVVARESVQKKLAAGLQLSDYHGNKAAVAAPDFVSPESPSADYLWLTVKCTGLDSAIEQLGSLVGPQTRILCCQNGLGSEQAVKDRYPNNEVLRVMVQFNVVELEPGKLHRGSEGAITIESLAGSDHSAKLAAEINCPLLPVHACDDMVALLWAKLQLNLGNGVNALADIPVKAMLEQRDFRRSFALLMSELIAVVRAKGIELPKVTAIPGHVIPKVMNVPNWVFNILGTKMLSVDPTVRTSMWWDLSAGKITEVHFLNGAVVDAGKEVGVACPANEALVKMIVEAENGERERGMSAKDMYRALAS